MMRTTRWFLLLAVLALVAAACAGGEDGAPGAAETDVATEAGVAAEATDTTTEAPEPAEDTATPEEADTDGLADNPLAGETITFVVGVGPGGGYDAYARLLSPFLGEALDADVIVQNTPGAGGLLALNEMLAAPADGTRIMLANGSGIGGSALAGAEGVQFELEDLAYVARVYAGDKVLSTGADSGYETIQDLMDTAEPFTVGSSGPGASTYVEPTVLSGLLGLNTEIITGFAGSSEIDAAVVAGDVDGIMVDLDSNLPLIEAGDTRPLLLVGDDRAEAVPDTPSLRDLELTPEQQELADAFLSLLELGRVVVAHPDTPPDVLETLRAAFNQILTDEAVISAAEAQGRPIEYVSGEEMVGIVETITSAPPEFVELVEAGY